jgi:hypothetical protein
MMYIIDRSRFLQVHRHDALSFKSIFHIDVIKQSLFAQFLSTDLTPATRCPAKVDYAVGVIENVENIIDLQ